MLAFIRKRLQSKERHHDHRSVKDGEQLKKKKEKSSSTIGELIAGPHISPSTDRVNESYSLVDYFPMKSGGLAISTEDSSADSYFNPSELLETKPTPTSRIIDIPITFIRNDSGKPHQQRS